MGSVRGNICGKKSLGVQAQDEISNPPVGAVEQFHRAASG